VVGICMYTQIEGWSFIDSLYFCVTTLTTVGYGDLGPKTKGAKLFTCLFVLVGIGLIGAALGIVGGYILDKQEELADDMFDDGDDSNNYFSPATSEMLSSALVLIVFVFTGTLFYCLHEDLHFVDGSTYLSSPSLPSASAISPRRLLAAACSPCSGCCVEWWRSRGRSGRSWMSSWRRGGYGGRRRC